ncbi:MAG: M48 family metallopeptidase [Candidatus Gracilibacteria bacterium]|nr:M48 family metallopeptidase [Candidatus Gracilibacteria bacterium]
MYNTYFYIIIFITILFFVIDKLIDYLNTLNWSQKLPKEAEGIFDIEKYSLQQSYEKAKHKFSNISGIFSFVLMLLVLIFGGFGFLDNFLRGYFSNEIVLTLAFFSIIILIQTIFSLPFSYYGTFVIEEKFGFNKMTKKLFFLDTIKTLLLTYLVGGVIFFILIWIYLKLGANFWWVAGIILSLFSVFIMMFYSSLIVPIFNKQTPLESGELRTAIEDFGKKVGFELDNIFVIDGSKRSSKANAYFSGFGPKKRIVLYDTLIKDLTVEELVAVLAHEIGHYKKKHTLQMLVFSIIQTFLIMFLFSLVINNSDIALALGSGKASFYIGAVAFGILFTPLNFFLGILGNILSRKNEYEADNFAKENYSAEALVSGLKKLATNNLTNLLPHKVYEFVHYSHPTVLKRIKSLTK